MSDNPSNDTVACQNPERRNSLRLRIRLAGQAMAELQAKKFLASPDSDNRACMFALEAEVDGNFPPEATAN